MIVARRETHHWTHQIVKAQLFFTVKVRANALDANARKHAAETNFIAGMSLTLAKNVFLKEVEQ
jgi:hypothetical protein